MHKSTRTSPRGIQLLLLSMAVTIWILSTGCRTTPNVIVIPDSQVETFVKSGQPFTPPFDGVFMSDGRYQRYRRAVADRILEETPK